MRSTVSPETTLRARRNGFVSNAKLEALPSPFTRILVVLKLRRPNDRYAEQFRRAFPTNYQVCTTILDQYQPAVHGEKIREQGNDCQSEVVLIVERTYKGKLLSLDAPDGDDFSQFSFEMRSMATNQSFWKGIASTPARAGEQFPARTIVSRLLRDGVIAGTMLRRTVAMAEQVGLAKSAP